VEASNVVSYFRPVSASFTSLRLFPPLLTPSQTFSFETLPISRVQIFVIRSRTIPFLFSIFREKSTSPLSQAELLPLPLPQSTFLDRKLRMINFICNEQVFSLLFPAFHASAGHRNPRLATPILLSLPPRPIVSSFAIFPPLKRAREFLSADQNKGLFHPLPAPPGRPPLDQNSFLAPQLLFLSFFQSFPASRRIRRLNLSSITPCSRFVFQRHGTRIFSKSSPCVLVDYFPLYPWPLFASHPRPLLHGGLFFTSPVAELQCKFELLFFSCT